MKYPIIALLLTLCAIPAAQAQQGDNGFYSCFVSNSDSSQHFYAHYLDDGAVDWVKHGSPAQKRTLKLIKSQPGPRTDGGSRAIMTTYLATGNGRQLGWYTFTRSGDRVSATYRATAGSPFVYFTARNKLSAKDYTDQSPCY